MASKNASYSNAIAPLGARNFSKTLSGLSLSQEMIDYLSELDGELHIVLSPYSTGPTIRIAKRGNTNTTLANAKELEKLSNYKAIIGKKLEENRKTEDLKLEHAIFKNARVIFNKGTDTSPDRILEANEQRFRMTQRQVELVTKQVEIIKTLPQSDEKKYITSKGKDLIRVLLDVMISCMGSHKVETEEYHALLLNGGIPRWIEKRLLDANFTKDVKLNAKPLLFSKSNHMKSIGLTKTEIGHAGFLAANAFITRGSNVILELAKNETFEKWILKGSAGDEDLLKENFYRFSWPMMGSAQIEEILEPRINRNKLTGFSITQTPKSRPGQDKRPETSHQRDNREMNNKLGLLVSIMVDYFHFVPRVDDPLTDVWSSFFKTEDWVITPENHLYHQINSVENRDTVLQRIRNNDLGITKTMMQAIILMNLRIPEKSTRGKELIAILSGLGTNGEEAIYKDLGNITKSKAKLTEATYAALSDATSFIASDSDEIQIFRGKRTTEARKSQKDDREVVRNLRKVSSKVKKQLKNITDDKLRKEIGSWIQENFRNESLQLLAVDRAIASIDRNLGYEEINYDSSDHSDSDSE